MSGPKILVVPIGRPPVALLQDVTAFLDRSLGSTSRLREDPLDPSLAWDGWRGQFDCRPILALLEGLDSDSGHLVLGIADADLFSTVFTFVFGEARLGGRAGIFSLHRLRTTFYGLPDDPELLAERARREALHEVGHLLGLVHCRQPDCVMRFAGSAEEIDLKSGQLCPACRDQIRASID